MPLTLARKGSPGRRTAVLLAALAALLLPLLVAPTSASAVPAAPLPSKAVWQRDVRSAMAGSLGYLTKRVAARAPGEKLAVVLDIDNTSLSTKYDWPEPVLPTRAFAKLAVRKKVTVYFVTGRKASDLGKVRQHLRRAGYRYAAICTRRSGERVEIGKQRCRRAITAKGFTITANVGNRATDFIGGNYEQRFKLPDYDLALS